MPRQPFRPVHELWGHHHTFCPVPLALLTQIPLLWPRDPARPDEPPPVHPAEYSTLMALIGLAYARPDWPVVTLSVRDIAQATGYSPKQARVCLHRLDALGLIRITRPDDPYRPNTRHQNRYDLQPLLILLAAHHKLTSAAAHIRSHQSQALQPRLIPDVIDPSTQLIAELATRSLAVANHYRHWRSSEPDPEPVGATVV